MSATGSADKLFIPKVWSDHTMAYFDKKLGISTFAMRDNTLTSSPGETVNFPYYKAIGAVEELDENTSMQVDKLGDDAFSVTVKEVGKAVGWKDKSIRVSANGPQWVKDEAEAQRQLGRVYAEKIEADCITAMNAASVPGHVETADVTGNIRSLMKSKILAFGDKADSAVACVMHSLDFMNIFTDSTAGFVHANATDPLFGKPGFTGRLLGMAVFVTDQVPAAANIVGKKAFYHYFLKANPFGIYMAEELKLERDRDILARETVIASTMWYGTLSLHGKVNALDYRVGRGVFSTGISA